MTYLIVFWRRFFLAKVSFESDELLLLVYFLYYNTTSRGNASYKCFGVKLFSGTP